VSGARVVVLMAVLALAVAVLDQGLVSLVEASGARDQPAAILVLLLSAFLGLLTAVVARAMRLPGSVAPTALVLGWIAVPPLFGAIPSQATDMLAGRASLNATEATALAVAVVSAAVTLAVSGRGD
jgi:type IV secretory pathway VirB6-like protein